MRAFVQRFTFVSVNRCILENVKAKILFWFILLFKGMLLLNTVDAYLRAIIIHLARYSINVNCTCLFVEMICRELHLSRDCNVWFAEMLLAIHSCLVIASWSDGIVPLIPNLIRNSNEQFPVNCGYVHKISFEIENRLRYCSTAINFQIIGI